MQAGIDKHQTRSRVLDQEGLDRNRHPGVLAHAEPEGASPGEPAGLAQQGRGGRQRAAGWRVGPPPGTAGGGGGGGQKRGGGGGGGRGGGGGAGPPPRQSA